MFERYTEKARRVIFFARYESSQFGSEAIEPEHILLGLIREDRGLVARFFPRSVFIDEVRKDIEGRIPIHPRTTISVNLPLSPTAKRVLALADEESERLQHRYIGTEHLLLGLLREDRTIAAEILYEYGLRLEAVRNELEQNPHKNVEAGVPSSHGMSEGYFRDPRFGELTRTLEHHQVVTHDEIQKEYKRIMLQLPFRALLNILRRKGTITEEEFKSLLTEAESYEEGAQDNS